MNYIRTTATAVEKLKKLARTIKQAEGVPHLEALERAAQQAGYGSWHHVQWCINRPATVAPDLRENTKEQIFLPTTKATVAERIRDILTNGPLPEGLSIRFSFPRTLTPREFTRAKRIADNSSCLFTQNPPSAESASYSLEWSAKSLRNMTIPETGRSDALRAVLDEVILSISQIDASEKPVWKGKGNLLPQVAANLASALGGEIEGELPYTKWRVIYCKDYPCGVELVQVRHALPLAIIGQFSDSEWAAYSLQDRKEAEMDSHSIAKLRTGHLPEEAG